MPIVIEDPIILTADSIKDFQTCARLYDYRHNDKLYEAISRRDLLADRFENILKRVLSFFFYKRQGGITPSYSALLSRWERLWFPKDMSSYDLAIEQHESAYGNLASFSNDAATALLQFYEDFESDPADPIMIDETFSMPMTDDSIYRLHGSFDLCLRNAKTGKYKVIKWTARHRRPSVASLMIDYAVLKYAFEYRNEKEKQVDYFLYDLVSTKGGYVPVEIKNEDIEALLFWANEIKEEKIYPSRRGLTYYCKACPFDAICEKWNGWVPDE